MNNLRAAIDTLFRRINPQDIIGNYYGLNTKKSSFSIDKESFVNQAFYHLPEYSHNELHNLLQKLNEDWGKDKDYDVRFCVFNIINTFSKTVLIEDKNEPLVDYKHILRWREISHLIGEDILTTSFLAKKDIIENHNRHYFAWSPVLSTNNLRLKKLLKKGVAENHFHLMGSAPHFVISWISLMNVVTGRKAQFVKFEAKGRYESGSVFSYGSSTSDLYTQCVKAACIRIFLFEKLKDVEESNAVFSYKDLKEILKGGKEETRYRLPDIQSDLDKLKHLYSCKFHESIKYAYADYAIPKNLNSQSFNGNALLIGERKFMYDVFKTIGKNGSLAKYQDLFYAYLVIKTNMREELIQVNKNTGFTNFQRYNGRKTDFMFWDDDIYSSAIVKMAVSSSKGNQNIKSFEARITPKNSIDDLLSIIDKTDAVISSNIFNEKETSLMNSLEEGIDKDYDCFYNTHFIKKGDKRKYGKGFDALRNQITARDNDVRKNIKQQAQVIASLRNGLYKQSKRILGIDAASSEIDARPEVLAQVFRYLKNHKIDGDKQLLFEDEEVPKLGATFHAGEDFLDIVDGLRAIDEAVKFLNLGQGDRIGHALALGVDVKAYYKFKSYTLMKPKQVHLDDVVWLLSRISKYGLYEYSDVVSLLKRDYCLLFHEIYCDTNNHSMLEHEIYYEAWKLRGDSPDLYETGVFNHKSSITFWERCGYNDMYPSKKDIRKIEDVSKLYYNYHFNPRVKEIGDKIKQVKVSKRFVQVVAEVQKYMQKEIARKHIAIETNPSSNLLIGPFSRYDEHPLMNFFNLGLEMDPQKIKDCPQLFVSINTDDQGVFNTYLENEYALMARALEKVEDEDGNPVYHSAMIYDWLDRIRQMGLEMSFKK